MTFTSFFVKRLLMKFNEIYCSCITFRLGRKLHLLQKMCNKIKINPSSSNDEEFILT